MILYIYTIKVKQVIDSDFNILHHRILLNAGIYEIATIHLQWLR